MPITPAQLAAAQLLQHGAAHDPSQQILLIAGPGTGKSFSIGERVHWLLSRGVQPNAIYAVSFTNAATDDLRKGIESYLSRQNITATGLRVSTLHSLALTSLMRARQLPLFPTKPRIVDNWELEHVYDAEHAVVSQCAPTRSRVVRTHYEAICSTKQPPLPYISNPQPPVSNQEDAQFQAFHRGVKGVYSCMLPGEAVRECVDRMNQGILDPVALLGIQHLIVDEYQDLNPVDVEFIDLMAARGTELFVCGDDDQSIYSFRYGSPVGIQGFTTRHGSATSHILTDCFRSTQNVFSSAQALLAAFAAPTRIPKTQVSAYASSAPPEPGVVHRWKFQAGNLEAQAIAESCRSLIGSGVPASEIMILFSNKRDLAREVEGALNTLAIPFNSVKQDLISSTPTGRFVGALLRAVTDPDDYLAVRTMLGMSKGVGAKSCAGIREKTHLNHLNFRQLLTGVAVPSGIFTTRESRSIALVQSYWQQVQGWQGTDSIAMHQTAIGNILLQAFKD